MMMNTRNLTWLVLGVALGMPGCDPGDDGDSGDDAAATGTMGDDDDDSSGGGDDSMADSSGGAAGAFDPVQAIIDANCSCHVTGSGGLTMGPDAYASLVGVASSAGIAYVEPGDPAASYLVHKLRDTQGTVGGGGGAMPLGGMLGEADIATIEAWITDGAQP